MKEQKIGFIGPGKMARAIVNGIISSKFLSSSNINIYGLALEDMAYFADLGCNTYVDLEKFHGCCDIVFLCVKPQNFSEVARSLKKLVSNKVLYVSILAGVTSDKIYELLDKRIKLIRAMPNTPLLIGKGATAVSCADDVADDELSTICKIFSSCGAVEIIDEELMNPIINVSGSTPAVIYLIAKYICEYAGDSGVDYKTALNMFCKTLIGSAYMMLQSESDLDSLISMVASKGGTTQAALDSFEEDKLRDIFFKALTACANRANELEK